MPTNVSKFAVPVGDAKFDSARSTGSKQCGYGGSIESNSVERNSLGEKQLLQALAVVE